MCCIGIHDCSIDVCVVLGFHDCSTDVCVVLGFHDCSTDVCVVLRFVDCPTNVCVVLRSNARAITASWGSAQHATGAAEQDSAGQLMLA